jgi:Hint module
VRLRGGEVRRMDALAVGDIVHIGDSVYSPVYMFSHKLPAGEHNFVQIAMSAGDTLRLSPGHLLAVNGAFAAAWTVARGDTLLLSSGGRAVVTEIRAVRGKGLYNPHTLDGRIAVDGVVCSTYTDAVHAGFAHSVLLAPCRAAWRLLGLECGGGLLHGNSRAGVLLRSAWGALLGSAGVRSEL